MTSGLRAASWRLSQRGRVDHADTQSEIVLGFLEALRTVEVDAPRLGRTLWRAASSHGWRNCRRSSREFSVCDPEMVGVRVTDHDRTHGSGAAELSRVTAAAEQVDEGRLEGGRLGSLAARAGLCDRARRRQAVEPIDHVVRYIRLGDRGSRADLPTAAITDAGRFYLRHGRHPDRPETPEAADAQTKPVVDTRVAAIRDSAAALVKRLAETSQRTLRITDPDDETRASYRRQIHAAKQYGLVPEGSILRHTGRASGDIVIRLLDARGQHAKLGYRFGGSGTQQELELSEQYDEVPRTPQRGGRGQSWQYYGSTEHVPSGRLQLTIERTGYGKNGYRNRDTWTDDKRGTLESRIRQIAKEAQAGFDADEAARLESERRWAEAQAQRLREQEVARLEQERKEAATRRDWEAAIAEARPQAVNAVRQATLVAALHAFRDARDLREICGILDESAIEADRADDTGLALNLRSWRDVGLALACQIDPTAGQRSLGRLSFEVEPNADDLRPFLNGWSPEGPRKEDPAKAGPSPRSADSPDWGSQPAEALAPRPKIVVVTLRVLS